MTRWSCAAVRKLRGVLVVLLSIALLGCMHRPAQAEGWELYKARFINAEGRVRDSGNRNISHSEGQGWGMLFAVAYNDRETFERLWTWTAANLQRSDLPLFAWRYDPSQANPVSDPNNASDGDVLIAWALHNASLRWQEPAYEVASAEIRAAVDAHLVIAFAGYTLLLPGLEGFKQDTETVVNLSYWIIPAFQQFARLEPEQAWQSLLDDAPRLLAAARFGVNGLPPDWLAVSEQRPPRPADGWPPRFGFDAVRVPLYFKWGRATAAELKPFLDFWSRDGDAVPPAWIDLTSGEQATFGASVGVLAIRALLANQDLPEPAVLADADYYATSLYLLSQLASSGQP